MLKSARKWGLVSWCILLGACSARPQTSTNSAAHAPEPNAGDESFLAGPLGRVRSRSLVFPIDFGLPNKPEWRIDDGPSWLVAKHASSSSELAFRTWREGRLVRRAECEAQARLARPSLPALDADTLLEQRPIAAPSGFDNELSVAIEPTPRGISGYAMVIGANVGQCYVGVFSTRVEGARAEEEVATRLGLVVDRVFSAVRLRDVDDRAVRRRLTSTPRATPE